MNKKQIKLSVEEWEQKYKPMINSLGDNDPEDCQDMFETYGEELEFVRNSDPKKIWTCIDSDFSDDTVIINGYHLVNRIGHYVCEVPVADDVESLGFVVGD